MALKEQLQHIFNADYPGVDVFITKVIKPIFGDEISRDEQKDLTAQYQQQVDNARISRLEYIADIENLNSFNIQFFDVTIDNNVNIERSRVNIQALIRSIVQSHTHILILFHYEDAKDKPWRFSYAYKPETNAQATSARRFTYVFGKDYRSRTAVERFLTLAASRCTDEDLLSAFAVDKLSDEFFDEYRKQYAKFVRYITGCEYVKKDGKWKEEQLDTPNEQFQSTFDEDKKMVRDYVKKMFGRIVFLYFLQRKGWLARKLNYMHELWANSDQKSNFLDGVLEPLFFEVLNTAKADRSEAARSLPLSEDIPYLNGGLFANEEIDDRRCIFPESLFDGLFDFLNRYNFTIDENDAEDAEVGIDPEMLGRIFESLLEDNKDKGAYYTPKEIVEYMCREAIIAYLNRDLPKRAHRCIRKFVETLNADKLDDKQRYYLRDRLQRVKICDPAIGSGAFPMGLVNLLSKLFLALKPNTDTAIMKRHIIEHCIYGVDIDRGAVDIARLRFWLSMIVEDKEPRPLPNLHFKIMQGNSIVESYEGRDLSKLASVSENNGGTFNFTKAEREELREELHRYYSTSIHAERDRIFTNVTNNIRRQICNEYNLSFPNGFDSSANDKFFLWHTWFCEVFDDGGFDIVIANPPYIKEYTSRKAFDGFRETSPYYQGKMDLWYGFACQGFDYLAPNGVLCFIATNNWVTNSGASILRNKILDDVCMVTLVDFNDYMVFEKSASIQTMILVATKTPQTEPYTFDYRKLTCDNPEKEDAIKLITETEFDSEFATHLSPTINRERYYNSTFNFTGSLSECILDKMESDATTLNDDDIAQGIVFPQDFLNKKGHDKLPAYPVGTGVFGLSAQELSNLNLSENEAVLIKPYFTSNQIKKYRTIEDNELWMIYTDSSYKKSDSLNGYPTIKSHLDKFQSVITSSNKPYGLHRARDQKFFQGAKIISQRKCSDTPIFSYSEFDTYVTQTYNVIKTDRFDLKFLTGLLNSKLIEFWLRNRGKMQGENFQVDKEPLMKIPIKTSDSIQPSIITLVDNILAAKVIDPNADTSAIEQQIDILVYRLYGLTYDEVLIVDPEPPFTRDEYENFTI